MGLTLDVALIVIIPVQVILAEDDTDDIPVGLSVNVGDPVSELDNERLGVGVSVVISVSFVMVYEPENEAHAMPFPVRRMAVTILLSVKNGRTAPVERV